MNPFAALGLPASPALTDEQVRAAWRAAAAATHPDRADGGNPPAYAAAQAAYAQLRTPWGRSEALADLAVLPHVPPAPARETVRWHALFTAAGVLPARIARGRPLAPAGPRRWSPLPPGTPPPAWSPAPPLSPPWKPGAACGGCSPPGLTSPRRPAANREQARANQCLRRASGSRKGDKAVRPLPVTVTRAEPSRPGPGRQAKPA